jgi:hypothetical protein
VLGLLAALLLTGCGTKSEPKASTTTVNRTVTSESLRSALLTADDLPAGYVEDTSQGGPTAPGTPDNPACAAALKGFKDSATVRRDAPNADAKFTAGEAGPFLLQSVSWLPGTEATRGFAAFRAALAKCASWSVTGPDGTKSTFTLVPMTFPTLGDDSYALRVTIQLAGLSVGANLVVFRAANALCVLVHSGVPSVPAAATETIGRTAVTKLAKLTP